MSSDQSSATLTGSLLANKGAAAPSNSVTAFLEEFPAAQQTAMNTCAVEPFDGNDPVCAINSFSEKRPKSRETSAKARTKLSLRLDPERHLRLKLAAAHLRRSSQAIMLDALDAYLSTVTANLDKDCHCLGDDN